MRAGRRGVRVEVLAAALLAAACASESAQNSGSALRLRKQTTADRKCASVPVCQDYLQQLRQRIYENWRGSESLPPGSVLVGFKLDLNGNVSAVRTFDASDAEAGRACRSAIVYASPFGLLPASLGFLANQPITLDLKLPAPVASGQRPSPRP